MVDRAYYQANKEKWRGYYLSDREGKIARQRGYNLKRHYGMTQADYEAMLERQGGVCAICGTDDPGRGRTGKRQPRYFHIDHCHATGKVRGLLCWRCNSVDLPKIERYILYANTA